MLLIHASVNASLLTIGIKYSMRDLICDANCCHSETAVALETKRSCESINVNDISAHCFISSLLISYMNSTMDYSATFQLLEL